MRFVPEHQALARDSSSALVCRVIPSETVTSPSVIVRMHFAGVCGTDLGMLMHARACSAQVLGHEGIGEVVDAPSTCSLQLGDFVAVNPLSRLDPQRVVGHTCEGVFREYVCCSAAKEEEDPVFVKIPRASQEVNSVLAEPLASALYGIDLLASESDTDDLIIVGSGSVSLLAARMWAMRPRSRVVIVAGNREHVTWLRNALTWLDNINIINEGDANQIINSYTPRFVRRAVLLCSSRATALSKLSLLLNLVEENGLVDLMTGFPENCRHPLLPDLSLSGVRSLHICGENRGSKCWEPVRLSGSTTVRFLGHRGTSPDQIMKAASLLQAGIISLDHIPHRTVSLREAPKLIEMMQNYSERRNLHFTKLIISLRSEFHLC
jgi:threonine dehydrogenase-like Zn-dependent dehydrogenase